MKHNINHASLHPSYNFNLQQFRLLQAIHTTTVTAALTLTDTYLCTAGKLLHATALYHLQNQDTNRDNNYKRMYHVL